MSAHGTMRVSRSNEFAFTSCEFCPEKTDAVIEFDNTNVDHGLVFEVCANCLRRALALLEAVPAEVFRKQVLAAADRQHRALMRHRDRYIKAFMAETGLKPSECRLVEQRHNDGRVTIQIQRRDEEVGSL